MSDGKIHKAVGALTGAIFGAHAIQDVVDPWSQAIIMASSIGGGIVGGKLPDVLEPALNDPRHRAVAHSWAVGLLCWGVGKKLVAIAEHCKAEAEQARQRWLASGKTDWMAFLQWVVGLAVFGFLWALTGGYGSHLALDSNTPAGLPLLAKGF